MIQSDFAGYGRFYLHKRIENKRGKKNADRGQNGMGNAKRFRKQPAQKVHAKVDAGTDGAVLARAVVIRFDGDKDGGKQRGGKDQKS
ncbi:MAG: hypothetical protein K6G29_03155 [Clostridiales bacterium]|nr:hypothetical protein [Clostridiales bacterium]